MLTDLQGTHACLWPCCSFVLAFYCLVVTGSHLASLKLGLYPRLARNSQRSIFLPSECWD